jgi:hypothetical protein
MSTTPSGRHGHKSGSSARNQYGLLTGNRVPGLRDYEGGLPEVCTNCIRAYRAQASTLEDSDQFLHYTFQDRGKISSLTVAGLTQGSVLINFRVEENTGHHETVAATAAGAPAQKTTLPYRDTGNHTGNQAEDRDGAIRHAIDDLTGGVAK